MQLKNKYIAFFLLGFLFSLLRFGAQNNIHAQNTNPALLYLDEKDSLRLAIDTLEALVLNKLNAVRQENNLFPLNEMEILQKAAEDQALYMARLNELIQIQVGLKKYPTDRTKYYGGSSKSKEIVLQLDFDYKKKETDWEKIAGKIVKELTELRANKEYVLDHRYFLIGLAIAPNRNNAYLYVSAVLGNYQSYNKGKFSRDTIHLPYNTSFMSNNIRLAYGFEPYDEEACKPLKRIFNLASLQKGLSLEGDKVYFETNNKRLLHKTIGGYDDRLAVDVVPALLYGCDHVNLIDNNQLNKGILLKGLTESQIHRRNIYRKTNKDSIKVKLGRLKYVQDLSGQRKVLGKTELNLVIIKNNHLCKVILPSNFDVTKGDYRFSGGLLVDTTYRENDRAIETKIFRNPAHLVFNIPFEKDKYNYNRQDIKPLLQAMNEPKYEVNHIRIIAYTSIEGSEDRNMELQQARAKSISGVLSSLSGDSVKMEVQAKDSWVLFKNDIASTRYAVLSTMKRDKAKNYIEENNLLEELEPMLSKHRFARVEMKVTYDTLLNSKERIINTRIRKFIENDLPKEAEKAQKYFLKKIIKEELDASFITGLQIPVKEAYAVMLMNNIWLQKYQEKEEVNEKDLDALKMIHSLNSDNPHIGYNYLYAFLVVEENIDFFQETWIDDLIADINASDLNKTMLKVLNFKLLIRKYNAFSKDRGKRSLAKRALKQMDEYVSNVQSAMEIAMIFYQTGDYESAMNILDPFLKQENVNEETIYTSLAIGINIDSFIYTRQFEYLMKKAFELDKDRFCRLINKGKLPVQVLENPVVKELYCKNCSVSFR